jgi:hypothetical protein
LNLKQSFEQRLKRQGIITPNEEKSLTNKEEEYYLEQFRNCRFWIWDKEEHKVEYRRTKGKCCFNHMIGLPVKNNQSHPIYPWQQEIFDALQQHKLILNTTMEYQQIGSVVHVEVTKRHLTV